MKEAWHSSWAYVAPQAQAIVVKDVGPDVQTHRHEKVARNQMVVAKPVATLQRFSKSMMNKFIETAYGIPHYYSVDVVEEVQGYCLASPISPMARFSIHVQEPLW